MVWGLPTCLIDCSCAGFCSICYSHQSPLLLQPKDGQDISAWELKHKNTNIPGKMKNKQKN